MKFIRRHWNKDLVMTVAEDIAGLVAISILFVVGLGLPALA